MRLFFVIAFAALVATHAIAGSAAPWADDLKLLSQCQDDVDKGGILALSARVNDLEAALAGEKKSMELAAAQRPESLVLTDGPTNSIMAMTLATTQMPIGATKVVAVDNPYPSMSFYLASYYDEVGQPSDALRVLDAELALSASDIGLTDHWVLQMTERGASLMALHRWTEVLENEDTALKTENLEEHLKAQLLRGRGYALTELNRLEEAQAAYQESLKLDPESKLAKHELAYIAGLIVGKPKALAGALTSVQKKPENQPANP